MLAPIGHWRFVIPPSSHSGGRAHLMAAFLAPHRQLARAKCPRYRASSAVQDAIPPWGPVLEDGLSSRWAISCYGWRIDVELDDKLSGHDAEAQVIKVAEAAPYSREIKLASIPERRLRRAAATNKGCVGQ